MVPAEFSLNPKEDVGTSEGLSFAPQMDAKVLIPSKRPQLTAKLHLGFKKRKYFLPLLLVWLCVCLFWLT